MEITLSSNLPIKLTPENDAFGTLKKADVIKSFLETVDLKENKMFVLYGAWGSGKTTIMDHLLENLDPDKYQGIKFEAWKYEKDDNLIFSLIDCLLAEAGISAKKIAKDFINTILITTKGFAKGVTIKLPGLSFNASKPIEALEEAIEKEENKTASLFEINKLLQEQFLKVEKEILGKAGVEKGKKTIVFIDDLDRCEPENVLNLLSALKLFFTYGNSTIFFCGIDKEAVQQAVRTQYEGVIKSEEYLEKVFDISFNMPLSFDSYKLLEHYFQGEINLANRTTPYASILNNFFKQLEFTNPRHLKKVLNKYEVLRSFKASPDLNSEYQRLIPDILINDSGNIVETIFTLYMIILFEFFPDRFKEIKNFPEKTDKYANLYADVMPGGKDRKTKMNHAYPTIEKRMEIRNKSLLDLSNAFNTFTTPELRNEKIILIVNLSLVFAPVNITAFDLYDENYRDHLKQFEGKDNSVLVNFCYFIGENQELIFNSGADLTPDYPITKYFDMAETLL